MSRLYRLRVALWPLKGTLLEEVVVTAQKRAERLQDVALPITESLPRSLCKNIEKPAVLNHDAVPGLHIARSNLRQNLRLLSTHFPSSHDTKVSGLILLIV